MGYWGWRPLLCGVFISAWVVGCDIVPNRTPSAAPSVYPSVTLTVGRLPTIGLSPPPTQASPATSITSEATASATPAPAYYLIQPGDTLDAIAARFHLSADTLRDANPDATLEPGENLLIPSPTPLHLNVQLPTCYETRPGSLLCLGKVDNPLDFAVESVMVEVSVAQVDGTTTLRRSTVEQMLIPAGSFAPYQASFEGEALASGSVNARMVSAVQSAETQALVLVEEIESEVLDGRVLIRAVIVNAESAQVELLRAFVTLLDSAGRVIGYRVLVFETGTVLNEGEDYPLNIEVTPQVSDDSPGYNVYVEARVIRD